MSLLRLLQDVDRVRVCVSSSENDAGSRKVELGLRSGYGFWLPDPGEDLGSTTSA